MSLRARNCWRFDPRTKLFLLLITVAGATFAPDLRYQFVLVSLVALFAVFCGLWWYALRSLIIYLLLCLATMWCMDVLTGTLRTSFVAFLGLVHRVYACGMLAGVLILTTRVNEFLAAMTRLRCPKSITIPFAVMLRYLPTIREDWRFIKDAMRMRDVSPTFSGFVRQPTLTVNCIYVPLLTAASKAADELSIAAVTRGIENPQPRTCLAKIRMRSTDWVAIAVFASFLITELYLRMVATS